MKTPEEIAREWPFTDEGVLRLSSRIRSYGDERAREMRERCATVPVPDWVAIDNREVVVEVVTRIRALPLEVNDE